VLRLDMGIEPRFNFREENLLIRFWRP